jgi:hypothetical protein
MVIRDGNGDSIPDFSWGIPLLGNGYVEVSSTTEDVNGGKSPPPSTGKRG